MKIIPFLVAFNFFSLVQCLGQGFEVSVAARPALTGLRGNPAIKSHFDPALYFSGGIGTSYFYRQNSFINFTIMVDQKGGKGKGKIIYLDEGNQKVEEPVSFESSFQYLTLPVQWGKRFGRKFNYEFGIGFYAGLLLKSHEISEGAGQSFKRNNTDQFKKIDIGFSASIATYIPIDSKFALKIAIDDNLGMMNASDLPVMNDGKIQHNSLGLVVGLNYMLK